LQKDKIAKLILIWYFVENVSVLLFLILIWEIASEIWNNPVFPSPIGVIREAYLLIISKELWLHIKTSFIRFISGYGIGVFLGVGIGGLMGIYRGWEELFTIPINIFRHIPGLAWIPLAVIWFGIGLKASIFVIALAAFFPVAINVALGLQRVGHIYIKAALTLGVKRNSLFMITRVLIPAALKSIFAGLRIGLAAGWAAIVAAEMVATTSGLGFMIQYYRRLLATNKVVVAMIIISLIGFLMDLTLRYLERRLLRV